MQGDDEDLAREAGTLAESIKPLLAGKDPMVQSAALADLLAIWLAGHIVPSDPEAQAEMREVLLRWHISLVHRLLPLADVERERRMAGRLQ